MAKKSKQTAQGAGAAYWSEIPASELKMLDNNPRLITEEELQALADSIANDPGFFSSRPCLVNHVDGEYIIYAGNQRFRAATEILGWNTIPCMIEENLPEDIVKARVIIDNTHHGDWDWAVLTEFGDKDTLMGWGVDFVEYKDEYADDYTPKYDPKASHNKVSEADIDKAQKDLEERITLRTNQTIEMICPHCGQEFEIPKSEIV